jgi:hypothetical protein
VRYTIEKYILSYGAGHYMKQQMPEFRAINLILSKKEKKIVASLLNIVTSGAAYNLVYPRPEPQKNNGCGY